MLFSSAGCCIALGVIAVLAVFAFITPGIIIALWRKHASKLIGTFQEPLCDKTCSADRVSSAQNTSLEMPELEEDPKTVNQ